MKTKLSVAKKQFEKNVSAVEKSFRRYIRSVDRDGLMHLFPGLVAGRGTALTPLSLDLSERFDSFVVDLSKQETEILNFCAITFVGEVEGTPGLQDVSSLAVCSQSSVHEKTPDPRGAITGGRFHTNVHSKREKNPWWRADFPPSVTVRHVYFYHRLGAPGPRMETLRIRGLVTGGPDTVLHHPFKAPKLHARTQIERALHGVRLLRSACNPGVLDAFDSHVKRAFDLLGLVMEAYPGPRRQEEKGLAASLRRQRALRRMARWQGVDGRSPKEEAVDQLLAACKLVLAHVRDFGFEPEDGIVAPVGEREARYIRVRTYNSGGLGIGGLSLHRGGAHTPALRVFERMAIRNDDWLEAYEHAPSFGLNLAGKVGYRVVDLDEPLRFDHVRIWNKNRARADGTMFTEIAISDDGKTWRNIYDHGAAFRAITAVRLLLDMLVGNAWPEAYAGLMGQMLALYRVRPLAKPLIQTVRQKQELLEQVLAGGRAAGKQVDYAARLIFTKHGMHIPLCERDENKLMADLVEFRDITEGLGLKPFLLYGTLLGAIREKGFIPHDDDLDTAVIVDGLGPDDLVAERDRIVALLLENGVACHAVKFGSPIVHYTRSTVTIDIFVLGHKDGKIYWPHDRLAIREERADIFLPLSELEFKGETFAAPKDPEAVSEARYGAGWRVPQPSFGL